MRHNKFYIIFFKYFYVALIGCDFIEYQKYSFYTKYFSQFFYYPNYLYAISLYQYFDWLFEKTQFRMR